MIKLNDLTGNENNISFYWNFNEGTGSLVADLKYHGNNGTINGAILVRKCMLNNGCTLF